MILIISNTWSSFPHLLDPFAYPQPVDSFLGHILTPKR